MKNNDFQIRPFLSLFLIIGTLLTVVFVKMELRRLGYSVLKMTRIEKSMIDERRRLDMKFARLTRPGRIEQLATSRLELKKAGRGQIVQMFYDDVGQANSLSRVQ